METELNNVASVVGNYNNIPTSITSLISVVTMIDGLTITKNTDKKNWADGELTYTIVISNNAEKTYESPVISVTIDNIPATEQEYQIEESTNTLTIKLTDINVSSSKTITFKVRKKE